MGCLRRERLHLLNAVDHDPVQLWVPGDPVPPEFIEATENPNWDAAGIWTHVGALPATGSWVRLTFDASDLAGYTIDVSNTYWISGKAWFDHYGKF